MKETDLNTPPEVVGITRANTKAMGLAEPVNPGTPGASGGSGRRAVAREYTLAPITHPLPKRVEKKIVRLLKRRAKAAAMYGECADLLKAIMAETRGSSREKVIVPGLVYKFTVPVTIDGKSKGTVQIVDQFAQPEVTAVKVLNRYELKTWKGDGPAAERPARLATAAEETFKAGEADELP